MEYKVDTIKQFESSLKLIIAGDSILIPCDMYPVVKHLIRSHAISIRCNDHYYEMPNCFPDPNSTGVEIIFITRKKELKELTYRDFEGKWLREDTKAEYKMHRHNGTAKLWNRTKVFDFIVCQPSNGTFLRFNQIQFKLIDYSGDSFKLQVDDKLVIFTRINDQ